MKIIHVVKKSANLFRRVFMYADWLLKESVWVCYKNEQDIVNPENGKATYSDDPHTWGTFSAACDYIDSHEGYTLGLQLGRSSGLSAVHISNCVNSDGSITKDQRINELILYCGSYSEYDLSGKGLTFLLSGNDIVPYEPYDKKVGEIEIRLYDHYQCIPLTGKPYNNFSDDEEEIYGIDPGVSPYIITRSPGFINVIYKWMAGKFSGIEKRDTDDKILLEIMEIKGLGDFSKRQLNDLLTNNQYFQYLWYNRIPSEKEEKRHDIDLVARIYSVVPHNSWEIINEIFKASPSYKLRSKESQLRFEDKEGKVNPGIAALVDNPTSKYRDVSVVMKGLIETAEKLNKEKDFMKYDNDVELLKDEIYGDIIDFETDQTCAEVFKKVCGDRVVFCIEDNAWFVFNGSYWKRENNKALANIRKYGEALADRLSKAIEWCDIDSKQKTKISRNIKKFANVSSFKRILESARSKMTVSKEEFNCKDQDLCVGNGIVNLKTGTLRRHDPADFFTFHTDVNYYPNYCRPHRFINFLDDIFEGDKELIAYFQRAMGYCITGDTSAQVFFVFYGSGQNGKSTLINILNAVLGDFAGTFDAYALAKKNDESKANPPLIQNKFKRYVTIPEKNDYTELDVALIKAISGGDRISARMLYKNNEDSFKPTYKMIFTTNFLPNINWDDNGIKRRYRIIPFNKNIKDKDVDPELADKIIVNEKEMILKWLVDGAKAYYEHDCRLDNLPKSMIKAMNAARYKQDSLYAYKNDCLEVTPDDKSYWIQADDLYKDYERWCIENGYNAETETMFGRRMHVVLGVNKEKHINIYYIGVKDKDGKLFIKKDTK